MKKYFLILCWFICFSSSAQVLTRGPYLTVSTPTSIIIQWNTDVASNAVVEYGTSLNALNNSVSSAASNLFHHEVKLTNLMPSTKYYYSIGTSLTTFQSGAENYFITAPLGSKFYDKPIRFWAMGDMGKQTQQQIDVKKAFLKFVDTNSVDGFILLGDNAYETGADLEYQNGFFNYYQTEILKHIPVIPCLGNHDYANNYTLRTTYQIPYFDIFALPSNGEAGGVPSFTERYYSHNYGNVHFIHLDSYGLELVAGNYYGLSDTIFSPQVNWLKQDLQANQMPWTIVCYHHPPYCLGTHNSDSELDLVALRTNLNPILERHNVDLVLNGHSHSYERSFFMKNHLGMEPTFDTLLHARQTSTGYYDGTLNSCAYIKNATKSSSDSGTVYAVVGSGSALPVVPFTAWPHNAMVSSSMENGSMLLTIEGNKLEALWLSTDTLNVIKDKFTIFKNVNTIDTIKTFLPDSLLLTANWMSKKYNWNTQDSSKSIHVFVAQNTLITVSDEWNCISKSFFITQNLPSSIFVSENNTPITVFPNPSKKAFSIELPSKENYTIRCFDEAGNLVKEEKFYSTNKSYSFELPSTSPKGNYFLLIANDKNQTWKHKISSY